jgi:hypothetical protein
MREYTDACEGYFEQKEIPEDKQVRKILAGLKDTHIKDWLSSERACLQELSFEEFIAEFRDNYLDKDWEEKTCCELLNISQGSNTFWDFATKVQAKNSLLLTTTSHLDAEKLRHQLEAGMDERLSRRCTTEKINKVVELKKWMAEVKRVDDALRADERVFERIARNARDADRRAHPLGEPSRRQNTNQSSTPTGANKNRTPRPADDRPRTPHLTEGERKLLFDNEGCLKYRRFYVTHRSADCPNDFPNPATYRQLTQADADMWKNHRNARSVAAVAQSDQQDSFDSPLHHIPAVASIAGPSRYPINYSTNNNSNVLEGGADSETDLDEVSNDILLPSQSIFRMGDCRSELLRSEHLYWHCAASGPTDNSFPIVFDALLDNGSHLAIVNSEWVDRLGLKRCKLHRPERIKLALIGKGKEDVELHEYCKLSLYDPSGTWSA